jgi:hypothetical protein
MKTAGQVSFPCFVSGLIIKKKEMIIKESKSPCSAWHPSPPSSSVRCDSYKPEGQDSCFDKPVAEVTGRGYGGGTLPSTRRRVNSNKERKIYSRVYATGRMGLYV